MEKLNYEIDCADQIINISMTVDQARTLQVACETISRLFIGQMDMLDWVCDADYETLKTVERICYHAGQRYSMHSDKLPDEARQLWDFYQVLRHHLSWRTQTNTPETRDWRKQMTVNYDEPEKLSEQPLPVIKEEKCE